MLTYSSLTGALAADRERALREKARTAWKRRQRGELQIRAATDADARALLRLARLDSQGRPPAGSIIVAEDDGALVAALSVDRRRHDRRPVPLDRGGRRDAAPPRRAAPRAHTARQAPHAAVAPPPPPGRRIRLTTGRRGS